MVVHSALPALLESAVAEVLGAAHVAHGDRDPMAAAEAAAADGLALIGPFTSRTVAEAVEATAPAGLPLIAPVATWAGVTRDDEPGCEDDPARHGGTVLRMVARDTWWLRGSPRTCRGLARARDRRRPRVRRPARRAAAAGRPVWLWRADATWELWPDRPL
jgi:ABC-type branched-subunit amino acid transport system substrate-binding protein